jgi:hypothetical protein
MAGCLGFFHRTSLTPLGQALAGRVLKAMAA